MVDDEVDGDEVGRTVDDDEDTPRTPTTTNPEYEDYGDDDDIASVEATTIQRGSDGEILPRREFVEELDADVVAKPLIDDARDRFLESVADPETDKEELSNAELAELLDTHLVAPDLTEHPLCENNRVTERFVREGMTDSMQDAYYIGVLLASDEHEYVRRMRRLERGQYTDGEVKYAVETEAREGGFKPQGSRSESETRRDRAEARGSR